MEYRARKVNWVAWVWLVLLFLAVVFAVLAERRAKGLEGGCVYMTGSSPLSGAVFFVSAVTVMNADGEFCLPDINCQRPGKVEVVAWGPGGLTVRSCVEAGSYSYFVWTESIQGSAGPAGLAPSPYRGNRFFLTADEERELGMLPEKGN
jgi:hypothetical protein